jgi:hypothetical protein
MMPALVTGLEISGALILFIGFLAWTMCAVAGEADDAFRAYDLKREAEE